MKGDTKRPPLQLRQ